MYLNVAQQAFCCLNAMMAANNDDNDEQQPEIGESQQAVRSHLRACYISLLVSATLSYDYPNTNNNPSTVKIFHLRLPRDLPMQLQLTSNNPQMKRMYAVYAYQK